MINDRNLTINYLLNKSNPFDNKYSSPAERNKLQIYFFDLTNTTNKTEPNFEQQKIFFQNNNLKYISNTYKNHLRNYSNENHTLSETSFNKYRQLIHNNFKNGNNYFNKTHKDQYYSNEEIGVSINEKNPESYKQKNLCKNKNFKNDSDKEYERKKLNKEINNFNFLVKKINKSIERNNRHKMRINDDIGNNDLINYKNNNYENKKENSVGEFILNETDAKNKNFQNMKNLKENNNKRNYKFNSMKSYTEEKINHNFIKFLKKSNLKLLNLNSIYKEIIDNFFYFINRLSKKFLFEEEIKDVNYYSSNIQSLSNLLINLEEHLAKLIKFERTNINQKSKKFEQELLSESRFIKINKNNFDNYENHKLRNNKTRNNFNFKEYLSMTNNNFHSKRSFMNKTQQNISKERNINEETEKENIQNNKQNKINLMKQNEKLIKVMNKLNLEDLSPKHKNINNKIVVNKNFLMNNPHKKFQQNLKFKSSNDLKSLLKQKLNK